MIGFDPMKTLSFSFRVLTTLDKTSEQGHLIGHECPVLIYVGKAEIQRLCNKYYQCIYMLLKVDLYTFTNFDELNTYLLNKFNIPAFQHRIIHLLSVYSFKMLNFASASKILKEECRSLVIIQLTLAFGGCG